MSLWLFAMLFWTISFTPGPNMLLAMSFGLSAGWRKTLPLIFGAVCGLACVAFVCGVGVGAIFSANELIFRSFMYACAMYLVYLAFKMWQNAKNVEFKAQKTSAKLGTLFLYGVTSCLSNPKGWAAFVALLPPFLDKTDPLNLKFALIIALIVAIEFANMCLYMLGGLMLRKFLAERNALLQRCGATLIAFIAVMMLLGLFFKF